MKHFLAIILMLLIGVGSNAQKALKDEIDHKLVTFQPHKIVYKNFVFPTSVDGQKIDLREYAQGKKVVLVTYFAAWCENSAHDYETIKHLQKKFGDKGLGIVGICNYSAKQEVIDFIKRHQLTYPIGLETTEEIARQKTTHFQYRKQCGDERKWGTPFTLLIEAKNIKVAGEVFAEDVLAANGEMDRKEAEKLIKKLLK